MTRDGLRRIGTEADAEGWRITTYQRPDSSTFIVGVTGVWSIQHSATASG